MVKVSAAAVRGLRAGHPWVFRDSLRRPIDGLAPGALMRVFDPDGAALAWALHEPEGAIAFRVVSYAEEFDWSDDELSARVDAAIQHRRTYVTDDVATAHRIVHGEGDGLPGLAVDRLGEYLLVYKLSLGAESYLERLLPILEAKCAPAGIYMQDRIRPVTAEDRRPPAFHMAGKAAPPEFEVTEDGLHFLVDVTAPVSPGLFLDLRDGRRWAEELSTGKRVLNLFSYTGAFGLRAVRGGATSVTNVDSAPRSHARCRQNLAASELDPEACEGLVGDAFKFLERMRRREERFDLVIVDPPPFSKVKGRVFSARSDWSELMSAVVQVVDPGGEVLAISNAAKLPEEELLGSIGTGALHRRRPVRLLGERGLPIDFPIPPAFTEGRYLKIKRLKVD